MIRSIGPQDADEFARLRREALADSPFAFGASPGDDIVSTPEGVSEVLGRSSDSAIFGAFEPELAGSLGIYRDHHHKSRHKATLWGMYVKPAFRRKGLARAMLEAVLDHARSMDGVSLVHVGVSSSASAARRLYESAGFVPWGEEPDALVFEGSIVSETHMAKRVAGGEGEVPGVTGINHLTWTVADIEEAFEFYVGVLGLKPVMKSSWSAYLLAGGTWLALVKGDPRKDERYDHLAFNVPLARFEETVERLRAAGAREWHENETEGESFYFEDPSGNRFEIHASDLSARIRHGRESWGDGVAWFV